MNDRELLRWAWSKKGLRVAMVLYAAGILCFVAVLFGATVVDQLGFWLVMSSGLLAVGWVLGFASWSYLRRDHDRGDAG
jgi:hypothetical protein